MPRCVADGKYWRSGLRAFWVAIAVASVVAVLGTLPAAVVVQIGKTSVLIGYGVVGAISWPDDEWNEDQPLVRLRTGCAAGNTVANFRVLGPMCRGGVSPLWPWLVGGSSLVVAMCALGKSNSKARCQR